MWLGTLIYFVIGTAILHGGIVLISWVNTYLLYAMLVLLELSWVWRHRTCRCISCSARTGLQFSTCSVWCCLPSWAFRAAVDRLAARRQEADRSRRVRRTCRAVCALPALVAGGPGRQFRSLPRPVILFPIRVPPGIRPPSRLGFIVGGSVILLGNIFAALSMLTSYIGLGVSLEDSYRDAASRRRTVPNWVLTSAVVLPPLVVALMKPDAFVRTLDIAGTFGGGLFVGVLPVLMVLRLRRSGVPQEFTTWGGSALAWIVMAVYVAGMLYTVATLTFGP